MPMKTPLSKRSGFAWGYWVLAVLVLYWAWSGTGIRFCELLKGIPSTLDFIQRMLPPDFTDWKVYVRAALETVQIAILGTSLAALIALPLSFLAARNITSVLWVYQSTRLLFDLCRGISEIIWGLLFVAAVGLGPPAGVLALAIHELGALGRYFSESIESTPVTIIEAAVSAGATKPQVIARVIIPEMKPYLIGYLLYYFEHGIRAASILGLVGAGGIGFLLETRISLFLYREVAAILTTIIILVVISDRLSAIARQRIIGERAFRS